jgi:hypothetical protein
MVGPTHRSDDYPRRVQLIDVAALVLGILLVLRAILSAIRTFVLPRAANDLIARMVFRSVRRVFDLATGPMKSYRRRDRVMSYFGPVALMTLPVAWLITVGIGYAFIFWAVGIHPLGQAIVDSGSSLLTLGFERPSALAGELIAFSEAVIGLGMVALLIAYLPTIYAAFSRRELLVTLLETRADSPPSPVVLITRLHRINGLDRLHGLWERWEQWFAELEETHTSLTVLVHFRSQQPERSWVNAAGAILDTAALVRSAVAIPVDAQADLMIRAGYLALRHVTGVFHLPFDASPTPASPTRIDRATFETVLDVLADSGVPLVADREAAWRDFHGWRVNYDEPLARLEALTVATQPWWTLPMHSARLTDEPPPEG